MARYKVTSEWRNTDYDRRAVAVTDDEGNRQVIQIQEADIVDTKNGARYDNGARRVVVDGKPFKRGKGGTVPFYGETAWSDAARAFDDLVTARRYGR